MQKIWLRNFEHQLAPQVWNKAQDIYAAGGIKMLREIEKHFWVALSESDEGRYEVECIITPNKVKAFTCECWEEGRKRMCAHVAAALLQIRLYLDKKLTEKEDAHHEKATEKLSPKLTVQNILKRITYEELFEFVQDYSRRDRDFALSLKTRFATEFSENDNPFFALLDSAIPKMAPGKAIKDQEFRRLRRLIDELETQITQANALGNARIIFQITTATLLKLGPLTQANTDSRNALLLEICQLTFKTLLDLNQKDLSPELQEQIRAFVLDLMVQNKLPKELVRGAIQFLAKQTVDQLFFDQISKSFYETSSEVKTPLLHLYLCAFSTRKMEYAIPRILEDPAYNPTAIKEAIVELYYQNQYAAAITGAEYFLDKGIFNPGQRREMEEIALLIAEQTADKARMRKFFSQRFKQTGFVEILRRWKIAAASKWPGELEWLIKDLQKNSDKSLLALVLAEEKELEVLAAFLEKEADLDLLARYEPLFAKLGVDFLAKLYIKILQQHLDEHFGKPAAAQVKETLVRLLQNSMGELASKIGFQLIQLYPDRPSLEEEIMELFPKGKRKFNRVL